MFEVDKYIDKKYSKHFNFFHLLQGNIETPFRKLVIYTALSGLSNALIISVINSSSHTTEYNKISWKYLLMFALALGVFIVTKRFVMEKTVILVEKSLTSIRHKVVNKLRHSDLHSIEGLGKDLIYARLTQDTTFISSASSVITNALQGVIMVLCTLIYIAFISMPAFLVALATIVLGSLTFVFKQKELESEFETTSRKEVDFFYALNNILGGFKEIRLNMDKNDAVYERLENISVDNQDLKIKTGMSYATIMIMSQVIFYLLLGAIVFLLPMFSKTYPESITKITSAVLFIVGPLTGVISSIQVFTRANVSIDNIRGLEAALERNEDSENARNQPKREFKDKIVLSKVRFAYTDAYGNAGFEVGPINLDIIKNEILFIVGGNGSGKSTIIKVLTGLYHSSGGTITMDGTRINRANIQSYRENFSTIFTDFHLFDRVYGVADLDPARVQELLVEMDMDSVVTFENGKFSNLHLSTGQKKRLALIYTLLDDRDIMVFDEVAADQDPTFRKKFYEKMLPGLKKDGKTVIMVTHDDMYFDACDRLVKVDYGQFVDYSHSPFSEEE